MFRSTIFQSCWDGATASWVFTITLGSLKCLAQGHYTAVVGFEPWTSRSGVWRYTTEPPHPRQIMRKPVFCICENKGPMCQTWQDVFSDDDQTREMHTRVIMKILSRPMMTRSISSYKIIKKMSRGQLFKVLLA